MLKYLISVLLVGGVISETWSGEHKVNRRFIEKESNADVDDVGVYKCTDDCLVLYKEVISQVNESINPCNDMLEYSCGAKTYYEPEKTLKNILPRIQTYVAGILNSPITNRDSRSLFIEKQLHQDCLNSGSRNEDENDLAFQTLRREVFDYVVRNNKWQDLDNKLFSLGFDHAFFDIKVIRDPEEPTRGLILLEPPSLQRIQMLNDDVNTVLSYINYYRTNSNWYNRSYYKDYTVWDKSKSINDLYDFLQESLLDSMHTFFESFLQARTTSSQKYSKNPTNVRMSMRELDNFYEQLSETGDFAEIELAATIVQTFKSVNLEISDTDDIVLKNRQYFIELAKFLNRVPNYIIALALWVKLITENLLYIDWNLSKTLKTINKSSFCLEETKLYASSYTFLDDFINAADTNIMSIRTLEDMLTNIINVIDVEVTGSQVLNSKEKIYFQHELKSISENFFNHVFDPPSKFYSDFVLTPSYFFNIVKYRQALKTVELLSLRNTASYSTPFSINEIHKFHNRFLLSIFTDNGIFSSSPLPKAVHYGNYGVKLASIIFSLINEYDFYDDTYDYERIKFFTYPEYSEETALCFIPKGIMKFSKAQVENIIDEIFSLRTAYLAFSQDATVQNYDHFTRTMLSRKKVTSSQLFFLSYVMNRCQLGDEAISTILSNTRSFLQVYNCDILDFKTELKCFLKHFDLKNKRIFPYKTVQQKLIV